MNLIVCITNEKKLKWQTDHGKCKQTKIHENVRNYVSKKNWETKWFVWIDYLRDESI